MLLSLNCTGVAWRGGGRKRSLAARDGDGDESKGGGGVIDGGEEERKKEEGNDILRVIFVIWLFFLHPFPLRNLGFFIQVHPSDYPCAVSKPKKKLELRPFTDGAIRAGVADPSSRRRRARPSGRNPAREGSIRPSGPP